ncbi:precorrin-6A synthase (deacetylating) [Pseudomonas sp. DWP3-1-2]|uniref:precorrin-6A synthase (deacetylating) n=1 Tax=Pseudomonas sp. DWP3-1-2 TaxID=2804645 RepID=UPI003CF24DD3
MKTVLLIGIGAGDPEHITVQAINALNRAQVFFILDKGYADDELLRLRTEICQRYITAPGYRIVVVHDPQRKADPLSYQRGVERWHEQRAVLFERLIDEELRPDETGGFLVWGDPSLYDSTLRILERVLSRGAIAFDYQVIPGISSVQALAAQHRIPLNRIGEPIQITTGRRLALDEGANVDNTVVMLDAHSAFEGFLGRGLHIYWGAYLGTDHEILIAGELDEVCEHIKHVRQKARQDRGWIMDAYLLRKLD